MAGARPYTPKTSLPIADIYADFGGGDHTPRGIRMRAQRLGVLLDNDSVVLDDIPALIPAFERGPTDAEVYFIQCGDFVKIGYTSYLGERICAIDLGTPHDTNLVTTILGGRSREAELHRRFAKYRHKGEWFRHEGALGDHIETLRVIENKYLEANR